MDDKRIYATTGALTWFCVRGIGGLDIYTDTPDGRYTIAVDNIGAGGAARLYGPHQPDDKVDENFMIFSSRSGALGFVANKYRKEATLLANTADRGEEKPHIVLPEMHGIVSGFSWFYGENQSIFTDTDLGRFQITPDGNEFILDTPTEYIATFSKRSDATLYARIIFDVMKAGEEGRKKAIAQFEAPAPSTPTNAIACNLSPFNHAMATRLIDAADAMSRAVDFLTPEAGPYLLKDRVREITDILAVERDWLLDLSAILQSEADEREETDAAAAAPSEPGAVPGKDSHSSGPAIDYKRTCDHLHFVIARKDSTIAAQKETIQNLKSELADARKLPHFVTQGEAGRHDREASELRAMIEGQQSELKLKQEEIEKLRFDLEAEKDRSSEKTRIISRQMNTINEQVKNIANLRKQIEAAASPHDCPSCGGSGHVDDASATFRDFREAAIEYMLPIFNKPFLLNFTEALEKGGFIITKPVKR